MPLCDKCGNIVAEADIRPVCVAKQTFDSPAEYAEICLECCGDDERDPDYERANLLFGEKHGGHL
jgi:hypothetical protein